MKAGQAKLPVAGRYKTPHIHVFTRENGGISRREQQAIDLVILGYSNPQIAQIMRCSRETVKSTLESVFQKKNVSSRYQLIVKISPGLEEKRRFLELEEIQLRNRLAAVKESLIALANYAAG